MVSQLAEHPLSEQLYPLGIGYYQLARGHEMRREQHDDFLLIYCLEGSGRVEFGTRGKRRIIRPGDLLVLPRGTPHHYWTDHKDPWSIYWIHFDGSLSQTFVDQLAIDPQSPLLSLGIHSRLVADFEAVLDMRQARHHLGSYLHSANQLRQLMTHIALLRPLAKLQQDEALDLEKVHSLMQARLHEQLDVETLAAAVSLSKYHFIKKYKTLTGTTPINHFIQLKIERACHLLDVTNKGIKEIAWAVGYEDAYYFSRIFRKMMGISPTQYREIRLGGSSYRS
ncbi:MmsAB operon transcriptional regulator MmsR [Marinobacterium maritimum]|uniref:MmsAB operon transcriptional regulator MmsR n=2 Tax=Marinobacterium maritimum TaxID=500162 RepID=A0ABN1I2E2_9GAMM